jgi:hypothetical protein
MGIMSRKKIPTDVMHKPSVMVWAELTPLSEHKKRETDGVEVKIVPTGSRKEPLPLSRATTDLRRAYPYIFDCAAYAKTHNPQKIDTDEFYSRFTMPYHKFLEYCLDDCTEQTQYLKEEIYELIKGQPAKYIKVSERTTVLAQPIIIAFKHTDLETGKEEYITNIGQDTKVDLVQVQILKELLDVSHGYLNLPKAFYAKIRRAFTEVKTLYSYFDSDGKSEDYRTLINKIKKDYSDNNLKLTTSEAANLYNHYQAGKIHLGKLEQGGYYPVYLALEYILAKKGRKAKEKEYSLLELCEKCYPELVQHINNNLYFKYRALADNFYMILNHTINHLYIKNVDIGIYQISNSREVGKDIMFTAYFKYTDPAITDPIKK